MKRFLLYSAVAAILALSVLAVAVFRGINHMVWADHAPFQIKALAIAVEIYKDGSGHYPNNLSALKDLDVENKKYLASLLSGTNGVQYSYTLMDKGFGICAAKTGNILWRGETMSNYFAANTLFNSTVTTVQSNRPAISNSGGSAASQ